MTPRLELSLVARRDPGEAVRGRQQDEAIAKNAQRPFERVMTVVAEPLRGTRVCQSHLRRIVSDVVLERTSWRRRKAKRWSEKKAAAGELAKALRSVEERRSHIERYLAKHWQTKRETSSA